MALDQHGALLKMGVIVSQHHLTGRLCWSWLSWFICLSTRKWERAPGEVNYFRGSDPTRWHTKLARYGHVLYRDLWPGVDMAVSAQAVVYLSPADKYHRLIRRLSKGQKVL